MPQSSSSSSVINANENSSQSPLYRPENNQSLIKVAVRVRPHEDCIWTTSSAADTSGRIEFTKKFLQTQPKRKIEAFQYGIVWLDFDHVPL